MKQANFEKFCCDCDHHFKRDDSIMCMGIVSLHYCSLNNEMEGNVYLGENREWENWDWQEGHDAPNNCPFLLEHILLNENE